MGSSYSAEISRRAFAASLASATALGPSMSFAVVPKRILMVLWRGETTVEHGFRRFFEERKLPVEFHVTSFDRDIARLSEILDQIERDPPDLIYTWGTPATLGIAGPASGDAAIISERVTTIPITFTMVSRPVAAGIVAELGPSGRNVTGVTHVAPVRAQIEAMRAYLPVSRIATIYTTTEPNSLISVKELTEASAAFDIRVDAFEVPNGRDGLPRVEALPGLIEEISGLAPQFLYLGPDSFLGQNAQVVTNAANQQGLPTFTATERSLSAADALFGLVAPYDAVGQLTALKAHQILFEGVDPGNIPVERLPQFSHVLRADVARQLGIFPALSLLDYAEIIERDG